MNWINEHKYALMIGYIYFLLIGYFSTPVGINSEPIIVDIQTREVDAYLSNIDEYVENLQKLDAKEQKMLDDIKRHTEVETTMVTLANEQEQEVSKLMNSFAEINPPEKLNLLQKSLIDTLKTRIETSKMAASAYSESDNDKFNQYVKLRRTYVRKLDATENIYKKYIISKKG